MPITPQDALQRIIENREIFHDEMVDLMRLVMRGEVSPVLTAAILSGLRVSQPSQGIDEADPVGIDILTSTRFQHHQADQIVYQGQHADLLPHVVFRLAPEHVEPQRLLEMSQIDFDAPAVEVQLSKLLRGIPHRI